MLVVVTGPDGAGKSTLCRELVARLPKAVECSIWDSLAAGCPFSSKTEVLTKISQLSHDERARVIFQLLNQSLRQALSRTTPAPRSIVLLNGYWFKYLASELAYGCSPEVTSELIQPFPEPDLVLALDLPAQDAWTRKSQVSFYESGLIQTFGRRKRPIHREEFIGFQSTINQHWIQIEENWNRKHPTKKWRHLDARKEPMALVKLALWELGES